MASLQAVKRRIRSVSSTKQITRAMQLVAASKLRRAQAAASEPQDYTSAANHVLAGLGREARIIANPLYAVRPVKNALTIVVAGERGMAGAYNSNVLKALQEVVTSRAVPQQAICLGRYAALHVARTPDVYEIAAYDLEQDNADLALARPVLREIIDLYLSEEIDCVDLIYTKFHSTVKQEVVTEQLLPVSLPLGDETGAIKLEPNPETLIDYATKRLLEAQLLQAILDAKASEQAARMLAMMNATDNAKDLIDDLTLEYNNARQAAITQEISEISSGAEAINDERRS